MQALVASKHTTGLMPGTFPSCFRAIFARISGVMASIVLLFGLCMASKVQGEARLSVSDWLLAGGLGAALVALQVYAFHHIGRGRLFKPQGS